MTRGLPMIIRLRVIISIVRELGSGDNTVFSKVQVVHRLINDFLDLLPVAAPLYELVNVLSGRGARPVSKSRSTCDRLTSGLYAPP